MLAITNYHLALSLGINTEDRDGYLRMGYFFCFNSFTDVNYEHIFTSIIIAYAFYDIWICNYLITTQR